MSDILYKGYPELTARLDAVRRVWARTHVAENVFKFVTIFCGVLLLFSLVAGLGPIPAVVRWGMLGVLAVLLVGGSVLFVFKPLFRQWTDEEIAVHVETRFPEIDNAVINALQLAKDPLADHPAFVARVVRRAEKDTRGIPFARSIDRRGVVRFGLAGGAVLLGLAVYAFGYGDTFGRALHRIVAPGAYVPNLGHARIIGVQPGTTVVVAGDPLRVIVQFEKLGAGDIDGTIHYRMQETAEAAREMTPLDADKLLFTFPEVRTPFTYKVRVGGTDSDVYQVGVTERPAVTRVDLAYRFPSYTGLAPRVEKDTNGDIKALAGSRVGLAVTANKAIRDGSIQGYGGDPALTVDKDNPRVLTGELTIKESGNYTIKITDRDNNENRSPVIHRVTALPDQKPTVRITVPGKDITAELNEKVTIAFEAADDFGIAAAELFARREHSSDPATPVVRWTKFTDPRNVQNTHVLQVDPKQYKAGDTIEYYVQVTDNCPAAQTAKTTPLLIKIQDRAKAAAEKAKNIEDWAERLRKVLDKELAIRSTAGGLEKTVDLAQFTGAAETLAKGQAEARLDVLRIAGDIQPTDPDVRRVKEVLVVLAGREMVSAVPHAEAMQKAAALPEKQAQLQPFEKEVDATIAAMKKLLDILPKMEEKAKKEIDDDKGVDLSKDAKEKLKDLERGLKDFVEEQKKVIDATQELTKKNVDDFTKEDDKKLKDLAATEDKWSQFLTEKINDLSKLPEQDFSNGTLLKELIAVQSEVQMAKDALAKKSTEIATAIEDNGLEMAKSLSAHIEKWLPDSPDRDQWKMEEMVGDSKAPMAELPKELEDLVGDLMEQEEDLMKDAEDATAGYADSLDKGAGWDAMDGPISNMSAQGVTGNRLPNQSEIGGRSGEGRSGKSSGEFVDENAVGKGGRNTPARLTPDAFEKGQVNDTSKDPAGGSTGGGKTSGAGAGGLEGPVPPQVEAKLKGLAAKQAELRNKAEKIDAKFKVMSWPSSFQETVKAMKQAEQDLRDGRYQNVLRQRPTILKNLKDSRTFLEDQVKVNKDASTPLPGNLQDEILDATEGGTPRGYEQLLKDYYKSISQEIK